MISLLPDGWMALHTQMKAVHWGFPSGLVRLISKELMRRTSTKELGIPKQCVFVVICNLPRLAVQLFLFGTGSWGQNTDQAGTSWGVLNVSLRSSAAQLG